MVAIFKLCTLEAGINKNKSFTLMLPIFDGDEVDMVGKLERRIQKIICVKDSIR